MNFNLSHGRLAIKYIFFELLPSFLLGVCVFIFVLLMFQILRLTEFVLLHGVSFRTVFEMMSYMSISFLPIIFPMSLIFTILLTYGRLSADSEIIAFKSLGLNHIHLSFPAIILGLIMTVASLQTSTTVAPWGNRQFESIIHNLRNMKATVTIKPGVFSEGFFDLVVYTNDIDKKTGLLKHVFIYDERNPKLPMTIIAKSGLLVQDQSKPKEKSLLKLMDGNIHRTDIDKYTKIDFDTYEINLHEGSSNRNRKKEALSYSSKELKQKILENKFEKKAELLAFKTEYYRRWALAFACMAFSAIGISLGIQSNRRSGKNNGAVVSITLIVIYWILYVTFEGLAKKGTITPALSVWIPNLLFFAFAASRYKKIAS